MEKYDATHLETKIKEMSNSLTNLADEKDFKEFLLIIRRPGWTTPAEGLLVTGLVDSMLAQTSALVGLKQVLLTGSRAVTTG